MNVKSIKFGSVGHTRIHTCITEKHTHTDRSIQSKEDGRFLNYINSTVQLGGEDARINNC